MDSDIAKYIECTMKHFRVIVFVLDLEHLEYQNTFDISLFRCKHWLGFFIASSNGLILMS